MNCSMCENHKKLHPKKETVKFKDCGLDNVTLMGVTTYQCDSCGEKYYNFGDLENLHEQIARALTAKEESLDGKEVRFLRKYLGFSSEFFSELTDKSIETISRYENNVEGYKVPKSIDTLLRMMVDKKLQDRNYDFHNFLLKQRHKQQTTIRLKEQAGGKWKLAASG